MNNDSIGAKREEIAKSLANKTGVAQEDVEKILDSLGLTGALKHRQYVSEITDCQGQDLRGLDNVALDNIRIAAGQLCM